MLPNPMFWHVAFPPERLDTAAPTCEIPHKTAGIALKSLHLPFCIDLDVIDAVRRPNRDALFEYGEFVCYVEKPSLDFNLRPGACDECCLL
jgi:hypothetical protein